MYLTSLDWTIVSVVMVSITLLAFWTKRYTQSVADFLSANRCAGRYLLTMAAGMSSLAVVSSVAAFEMFPVWKSRSELFMGQRSAVHGRRL